jgi:hypothetical protein
MRHQGAQKNLLPLEPPANEKIAKLVKVKHSIFQTGTARRIQNMLKYVFKETLVWLLGASVLTAAPLAQAAQWLVVEAQDL